MKYTKLLTTSIVLASGLFLGSLSGCASSASEADMITILSRVNELNDALFDGNGMLNKLKTDYSGIEKQIDSLKYRLTHNNKKPPVVKKPDVKKPKPKIIKHKKKHDNN